MLDDSMLAAIGVSRIRLPVPTAKLFVVHDIASGLRHPDSRRTVGEALLKFLSRLQLESEVLEVIAALVVAQDALPLTVRQIKEAIARPSLVSDHYLDRMFGTGLELHSGPIRHSGPSPSFYDSRPTLQELRQGHFVPPILGSKLEELEATTGHGFLDQWAHEFTVLSARSSSSAGHLDYFFDADRDQSTGQFITRKSHVARSAYLRALAFAVDAWDMPESLATATALHASPFDDFYLRMPGGQPPPWSKAIERRLSSSADATDLVGVMLEAVRAVEPGQALLHFNGPIVFDRLLQADLEIMPILTQGSGVDAADVFRVYEWLLGRQVLRRQPDGSLGIPPSTHQSLRVDETTTIVPALVPTVGHTIGYLHSDLLQRIPFAPANYSRGELIRIVPNLGGAEVLLDGVTSGRISYWNPCWKPAHLKDLGPGSAVSLSITETLRSRLFDVPGFELRYFWRARVMSRDKEYGTWNSEVLCGALGS